jgi:hypothetical protein
MKYIILIVFIFSPTLLFPENLPEKTTDKTTKPEPPGFHRHDGFYFNTQIGFGSSYVYINTPDPINASNTALLIKYQIGYAFIENLAFFWEQGFNYSLGKSIKPDKYPNGDTPPVYESYIAGFGAKYYYMPENYFFSASCSYNHTGKACFGNESSSSGTPGIGHGLIVKGFGATISFGREWWTDDNLARGVSLYWFYGIDETSTTHFKEKYSAREIQLGIAFSETYN